ncbi:2-hydroxyacyl-CoA dehydratase [Pararhodobacter marinus]|uniref:2-hydroxyacyl-CoA dehydratase n=1 Tax=Pararhodobacter marinus TaxID=2184063 RepID=A0A2U2CBC0_9RHOB|nr:2-hydroxyacyl-CoA dehydratase family protein [Pararhodobacter marinus]PWE29159.1 2-hydroxyacyl-CoA dehydratase [Pararhodobacter marinus]
MTPALPCSAEAAAYQRDWAKSLRARLAGGEAYAFANADTPMEVFHALDMPVVVNQWWSSVIAAKKLSGLHLDASEAMGFHARLAKYSALPLFAAMDGRPETQPWGGLPVPGLLCARASADDHPLIFAEWARLTGAPLKILSAPGHPDPQPDWWTPLRRDWEDTVGADRLDLMAGEIAELTEMAEQVAGRRTPDGALAQLMERIDRQERIFEDCARMIADAPRLPVRISEMIPNVMIPQWHRGSDWALAHAERFRDALAAQIASGAAVCPDERVRMMWIGAGLWFDTGFYTAFEHQGAVFAWSMYLPFAADGYIRADHGDPVRALAARVSDINEHLHQPPWAGAWHVKEARANRIDLAVIIVPSADRPSGYGTRFIARALEEAGVATVMLDADMVDARGWDGTEARARVQAGIDRVTEGRRAKGR